MNRGWRITRLAGIDVSMHWSFLLLLAWILVSALSTGAGVFAAARQLGFVLAAFTCVVLHEFGHAMAARWFGVRTHQITLLPIGGVAQLDRIPRNPWQELVIALAGPAVNLVIAALLTPVVVAMFGMSSITASAVLGGQLLSQLLVFNIVMIVFNLLPAFPMDGGRVLRAFLALRAPYLQATSWAVRVGQMMAMVFAVAGLFVNPFLVLIALFVLLAGNGELAQLRSEMAHRYPFVPDGAFTGPPAAWAPSDFRWNGPPSERKATIVFQPPSEHKPAQVIIVAERV